MYVLNLTSEMLIGRPRQLQTPSRMRNIGRKLYGRNSMPSELLVFRYVNFYALLVQLMFIYLIKLFSQLCLVY